jgi:hypothetical protein
MRYRKGRKNCNEGHVRERERKEKEEDPEIDRASKGGREVDK